MKPSNRIPLVAATLVVLAVVAGTFMLRGRDKPTLDDGRQGQPAAALVTSAPPPAATPAAVGGADRAGSAELARGDHVARRAAMRQEQAARTRALREQSAQRFASEQVDPAWAPQKERELS